MACRGLVTLDLEGVDLTLEAFHQFLTANAKLQHVSLSQLIFTQTPATTSSILPSVQLSQLRTLRLVNIPHAQIAQVLTMVAPGNCGLSLLVDPYVDWVLNDTLRHAFAEFCRRSSVKCYPVSL